MPAAQPCRALCFYASLRRSKFTANPKSARSQTARGPQNTKKLQTSPFTLMKTASRMPEKTSIFPLFGLLRTMVCSRTHTWANVASAERQKFFFHTKKCRFQGTVTATLPIWYKLYANNISFLSLKTTVFSYEKYFCLSAPATFAWVWVLEQTVVRKTEIYCSLSDQNP